MKKKIIYFKEPFKYRMKLLKFRKRSLGYGFFIFPVLLPTVLFFIGGFVGTLVIRYLEHKIVNIFNVSLVMGIVGGVLGGIGGVFSAFISQTVSSRIWFYEDTLRAYYEFKSVIFPYSEIEAFHFLKDSGTDFASTALSILFRNGTHFTIGIPDKTDKSIVRSFLESKGIRYCEDIQNREEWPMKD